VFVDNCVSLVPVKAVVCTDPSSVYIEYLLWKTPSGIVKVAPVGKVKAVATREASYHKSSRVAIFPVLVAILPVFMAISAIFSLIQTEF
jgi:hypothetical protein